MSSSNSSLGFTNISLQSLSNGYWQTIPGTISWTDSVDWDTPKDRFNIKEVISNPPFLIINWLNREKTVVKCGENETYDLEKAIVYAIAKRAIGITKILKAVEDVKIQKPKDKKLLNSPEVDIPF